MVFSRSRLVTLRSICSKGALAALALVTALVAFGARPAAADDRASLERGRTAARGLLILEDARICGIVQLRERCIADVEALLHGRGDGDFATIPGIGPHPATGLRAFVANGDRDALDLTLRVTIPTDPGRWIADPRDAALFDAGIVDVTLPAAAAQDITHQVDSALPVVDLAKHAAQIPAGTLPLDPGVLRTIAKREDILPFARAFVAAIDRSAPPPPLIPLAPAEGPAADIELGLATQAVGELAQSPRWIVQDDAQRFISALTSRYEQLAPDSAGAGARLRAVTRPGALDREATIEALRSLDAALMTKLERRRYQRVVVGVALAQLAYASAITHSESLARSMLSVLASTPVIDDAVPGWAAARVQGSAIRSSDWVAQHAYAVRLVELVQKANRP